ncbi:C-5 cytosine-specific DNA methylase superfamily [Synechococcus sp. PCC 7335]|uniref:DNA cytosine methyltransferase n=1 Tax=Synechococcus sp. (strain ATCC 29403 / PCC 7335) TaxID=91464 RepID=UPI00017EB49C|nr:DNA cytosine methyltransferase [Synechococcus sp. PCC 7335]EDX84112.1 C-5 cytosine-specific DNA methylase superfamily [Synechococcus sp. PCC 7335]
MDSAENNRPIAIDLFAGAGGLCLGFEQAGFDVPVAIEIDPIHAAVHRFNFPLCKVIPRSVKEVTGKEILSVAKLSSQQPITAVIGGAPCQGFSVMGPRSLCDPRNELVKDFLRLVDELQPSYFVFENVKGLTCDRNRPVLEAIIDQIAAINYRLVDPWQVLNARNYGIPQNRERLFLVGARNNTCLPIYPKPLKHSPTCTHALGDLPDVEQFHSLINKGEVIVCLSQPHSAYAARLRCQSRRGWYYGYRRQWDPSLLTNSIRTNHSQQSRDRFARTPPGTREPITRFFRLPPDGVCNTLRAGTDSARGSFTSPRPIHYRYARCITVREMARLHGFPDWFRFHSTKWHGARQVGNSVPPPLARAIALEILKVLDHTPTVPTQILPAGNEQLLTMVASEAAAYWGIESPIRQRNKVPSRSANSLELAKV